jgi:GTP-binding protein
MPGEERWLQLELKLLADVGFVGFPNAGKSTLIAAVSAARPKIADYPFTTLEPNLGVVSWSDERSFVVADIPGLIEGAHEGKGLGFQFLRHIERTLFLLHLVDIGEWTAEDPVTSFEVMRQELASYNVSLQEKPFAVVGTKLDLQGNGERLRRLERHCRDHGLSFFAISAVTREGVLPLVQFLGTTVDSLKAGCETKS